MRALLLLSALIFCGCGSENPSALPGAGIPLSISGRTSDSAGSGAGISPDEQQKAIASQTSDLVKQLTQRANAAVTAGTPATAVEAMSQAIGIQPENAQLFRIRADVYVLLNELANARADFSTAIRLAPEDADLYNVRGYFLMSQGLTAEAVTDFEKALELDPAHAAAANNRGLVALAAENYKEAQIWFDKAIASDRKHADAWNNRGFVRMKQKQYETALEDVQQALRLRENYATAWNNCGLIHMHMGNLAAADNAFTRLIEISPMDVRWYNHRRAVRLKQERFADAQLDASQIQWLNELSELSRAAATRSTDPKVWIQRAEHLTAGRQYGAAAQDFSRALLVNPGNTEALTGRAVAWMNTGDLQKAMQDCDESIVAEASTKAYSVRGDLWLNLKNYDQAIADYEAASRFDDKVAEAYELRARKFREENDTEKAAEDETRAREIRAALAGELRDDPAGNQPPQPFPDSESSPE